MSQPNQQADLLTRSEYDMFNSHRKRLILVGGLALAFAATMVFLRGCFHIEPHPAVHFIFIVPITIWGLIQGFKFRCPRCDAIPLTTRPSVGGRDVEVSGFVALFPTKCHKCGVLFRTAE
jgi:hypothetical protein